MKSSIFSRIILTICLATFMSAHTQGNGTTLTDQQKINALKYGSVGLASLIASTNACHAIFLNAALGAAVYSGAAHLGGKDLARVYAGRVALITLIALGIKFFEKPVKVVAPPLLLWLLNDEQAPRVLGATLKGEAELFTTVASRVLTIQQRKTLAARLLNLFGISAEHTTTGLNKLFGIQAEDVQ